MKTKTRRLQQIRTTPDNPPINLIGLLPEYQEGFQLGGWFQGKYSYLWFGIGKKGPVLGTLSGQKLYRLAKAIVQRFEEDPDNH